MRNNLAKRWVMGVLMVLALLPVGLQAQNAADLSRKLELLNAYPEAIVVNGKVYTIDASMRQVQALAVKNGRIMAIGTNDEIRFLAGPQTEVIDAKGRAVLPGMLDSHTHPHLWAVEHWMGSEGDFAAKRYNDPQMQIHYAKGNDPATILRELERIVREKTQAMGPNKWLWVNLFGGKDLPENRKISYGLFPTSGPAGGGATDAPLTREFLDTLAPNNPLMVMVGEAIGPGANNSMARDEMVKYIGSETVGLQSRNAVTYEILFRNRLDDAVDFVKRELLTCIAAQGITTFANHYYNSPSIMKVYTTMKERNEMPVRWAWFLGGSNQKVGGNSDPEIEAYFSTLGDFVGVGDDFIWNAGIANEGWEWGPQGQGGIGTCTGATPLPNPPMEGQLYMPCEGNLDDLEQFGGYRFVRAALRAGLRIGYLHFYSDGTFDALFKMLDEEVESGRITVDQIRALRISTEHNPMIRPDSMANIAKYNIMPGFNGYQVQGDIKGGAFLKNYGEQYMSWLAPMRSVMEAGAKPVFNTDLHLYKVLPESKDMDYPEQWDGNIFALLEFFVTRKMPHDGITYARSEGMDRASLMKSATIWGAEQVMNEKNIGSLEVGKLADFFITDKDFFTVPDDEIHTIKVMLTATGGKTVYKATNY